MITIIKEVSATGYKSHDYDVCPSSHKAVVHDALLVWTKDCCLALVPVVIVTVMLILNFVHCEITACDSDNKQSLILSSQLLFSFASSKPAIFLYPVCLT